MKSPATMKTNFLLLISTIPALANSSFDNTAKYAWSANTGWLSFRHDQPSSPQGVRIGETHLSGLAWSANIGWINFGSTPANGHTYTNTASNHGVNHDGAGNLSGYAWSANTGWINFGWTNTSDANRPRLNLQTGEMNGLAWSPNTGWLNLSTSLLTAQSIDRPDTDGDGIPDAWENQKFGNLTTANASTDTDKDGVPDLHEYRADTNPNNPQNYLRIVSQTHNGAFTETTIEFTSTPTRLYRLEFSNNLENPWTDSPLGTFRPSNNPTTTRTITYPGNPKKFFRAVAVLPLAP